MNVDRHNTHYEYFMKGQKQATTEEEKDVGACN
jgi:hypothetical protein